MPEPAPRPPKRTRVDPDGSHPPSPLLNPSSILPPSQVKCERSSSPLSVERRLVTSGTKRFAPVPNDCLPSCTRYKHNRSEWVARCAKELEALNLTSERKLIRDDGLIIDWKSDVPVWSDTLKPDPLDLAATIMLAHRSNAQWHRPPFRKDSPPKSATIVSTQECPTTSPPILGDVSDVAPPLRKKLPVPPRPSSKRLNNHSQPIFVNTPPSGPGSSSPYRVHIPSDTQHDQVAVPPKPLSRVCDRSIAPCTSSKAEEEMSEMTLSYIRRYVQTYEADRASLASAYARNASFAYRVHQLIQNISGGGSSVRTASPQCFFSGTKRTRLDIVTTLLTLPCLHSNTQSSGIAQIEYDIFYLGVELGMFVNCRVVISAKTVVHSLILQRKEVDVEDAAIEGVWPLTAIAHQILVFQT
ncbi:hypothetical protein J3R83DRAFT_12347 [Lanmaoa asiatica]|nr:hypothetical protein J3R83DRAFT_12347 [Lanmaoa asiatica]